LAATACRGIFGVHDRWTLKANSYHFYQNVGWATLMKALRCKMFMQKDLVFKGQRGKHRKSHLPNTPRYLGGHY
jgi:hypothetical protein